MPAFKLQGMLVYCSAHTEQIRFYPVSSAIKAFEKDLVKYERSKGTIRFPLDEPIPGNLLSKIVKFKVKENEEKIIAKEKKKQIKNEIFIDNSFQFYLIPSVKTNYFSINFH